MVDAFCNILVASSQYSRAVVVAIQKSAPKFKSVSCNVKRMAVG